MVVFKRTSSGRTRSSITNGAGYLLFAPSAPRPFRLSESSAQNEREREKERGRVVSMGRVDRRERKRKRGTSKKRLFEAFGA